jgi:eukaryotic-like serine/threonine-protein kinase
VSNLNSKELLSLVQHGNSQAATAIFDRYVQRLLALARARIGPKLRRRIDADDVVQSAYRSFFVHASNGEYALTESGDLWRLLASVTLHKLYGQVELHTAARRSMNREDAVNQISANDRAAPEPTAAEIIAITEQLQLVSKRLTADERTVLTANLQGDSVATIAKAIQKSPRTVRRLLDQSRRAIEQYLLADEDGGSRRRARRDYREPEAFAPLLYADYVFERLVGAGGMGKVYRATQRSTGEHVAIKTLHKSRQADRRAVEKFLQEAQFLERLIIPTLFGSEDSGVSPAAATSS